MSTWLLALALCAAQSERSVLVELERFDKLLSAAEARLAEIAAERASVQREIARLQAELAASRVRGQEAFGQFARRVRALAQMPAGARVVLLGGSRSLSDYLESTRVLRWVAAHDRQLHDHYVSEANKIAALEEAMRVRRQSLTRLEVEQRDKRDTLMVGRREKLALAEAVVKRRDLAARLAVERSSAGRSLAAMIRKLSPVGHPRRRFADNRGRLPWPAVGPVDVSFGQKIERDTGTATTHNGLDIRATTGTDVQAIAAGEVVFSDWLRGYGQTVILDHGDGYHTLYAHLGTRGITVGDSVAQGATLGTVGDTGSLKGTLLYFEVRHQGRPVDPAIWLRR
jgi:septal ring factor EnvC (AmiA/AmiB activator)